MGTPETPLNSNEPGESGGTSETGRPIPGESEGGESENVITERPLNDRHSGGEGESEGTNSAIEEGGTHECIKIRKRTLLRFYAEKSLETYLTWLQSTRSHECEHKQKKLSNIVKEFKKLQKRVDLVMKEKCDDDNLNSDLKGDFVTFQRQL